MQTHIALFVALLMATTANAQNQGEIMKDTKQAQTLCLGRFLVDVPKEADIVAGREEYRWDKVSLTRKVSQEAFQKSILDKEKMLKETKHKTEPSLLKLFSRSNDENSVVMVFWETPSSKYGYETEGYKWIKGFQFLVKGTADDDRASSKAEKINRTLAELQYRRDGEIPTTPGFCIDGGFFAGEPALPHSEHAAISIRLKNHPEVLVRIYTDMNGEKVEESLLTRVDRKETPAIYKELAKQIKTLRRGKHPVGTFQAEELLETYPTDYSYSIHQFVWESSGKPRDLYAPTIVVNMETGETSDHVDMRPSLTNKQAIELFDSIVNSIRLRPIGGAAASPDKPVPPPSPQSKAPLGTTLSSGTRCPQTGTWVCDKAEAKGGIRHVFHEGETLPSVLTPVRLGFWLKLKGEAPTRLNSAAWTLTELPPEVNS